MLTGVITIIGGILAASSLIIARKPDAKELIDKLTPYQGWLGVGMFAWGIWAVLQVVLHLGLFLDYSILYTVIAFAAAGLNVVVGFLLGFGLILKYALGRNAAAQARGHQIRAKLAAYQGVFGLLAIASGALFLVMSLIR